MVIHTYPIQNEEVYFSSVGIDGTTKAITLNNATTTAHEIK
jgi:hypothetical protein